MNELAIPTLHRFLNAEPVQFDQSDLSVSNDLAQDSHKIRRTLPEFVGKQLESKILVCETHARSIVIYVLQGYENSQQLQEVRQSVVREFSKASIEVKTCTARALLSYAKQHGDREQGAKQTTSSYEKVLEDIVGFAVKESASDITIDIHKDKPDSPISFKIDGRQIRLDAWRMPTKRLEEVINIAWQNVSGGAQSSFEQDVDAQGIYTIVVHKRDFKLRFQSIIVDAGPSVSLRLLEQGAARPLNEYGYLPQQLALLKRYKNSRSGFIVFSGKVDSGKTTSLTALMNELPRHFKSYMLEDPVEIILPDVYQITMSRPVDGSGDEKYAMKLMAMKRVAPDAVSLGEVRDKLNARAVADVGGMGILGLFTVHAGSALHAPQKLWSDSVGVPKDYLASPGMFKLFVHQALIPKLCSCAKPLQTLTVDGGLDNDGDYQDGAYWTRYIQRIEHAFKISTAGMKVRNHLGCDKCRREHFKDLDGYRGRQLIAEIVEAGKHYELLRLIGMGDSLGMHEYANTLKRTKIDNPDMSNKTIVECGMYLALQGIVDPRDIEQATEPFENLILQPRYAGN